MEATGFRAALPVNKRPAASCATDTGEWLTEFSRDGDLKEGDREGQEVVMDEYQMIEKHHIEPHPSQGNTVVVHQAMNGPARAARLQLQRQGWEDLAQALNAAEVSHDRVISTELQCHDQSVHCTTWPQPKLRLTMHGAGVLIVHDARQLVDTFQRTRL